MDDEFRSLRDRTFSWQITSTIYRALDPSIAEFRLLVLRAGRAEDSIQAELQQACLKGPLQPVPHYETISYCWGDSTDVATIQINQRSVWIPASAAAALRCMREARSDRVLWLDAVCINQADLDERAQQVGMMADIYSNSQGNLIYLGEETEFTLRAIESIYTCLEDMKKATHNLQVVDGTPMDYHSIDNFWTHGGRNNNIDVEAIDSFFSNPWFR